MPTYLGQTVSDEYLQGLLENYRQGQQDAGAPVEDGDQAILDRLDECGVTKNTGAAVVGRHDGRQALGG
jgi:hypothetical protein